MQRTNEEGGDILERAASNLHTLKVVMSPDGDVGNAEFREIRLSSLEDLDIKYDSGSKGFRPAANLLKAILCPALARLSLTAHTQAEYSELTGTMRGRYPELTAFTLLIVNLHHPEEVFLFGDIIRPLQSTIRKLKVEPASNTVRMVLQASRTSDIGLSKVLYLLREPHAPGFADLHHPGGELPCQAFRDSPEYPRIPELFPTRQAQDADI